MVGKLQDDIKCTDFTVLEKKTEEEKKVVAQKTTHSLPVN